MKDGNYGLRNRPLNAKNSIYQVGNVELLSINSWHKFGKITKLQNDKWSTNTNLNLEINGLDKVGKTKLLNSLLFSDKKLRKA